MLESLTKAGGITRLALRRPEKKLVEIGDQTYEAWILKNGRAAREVYGAVDYASYVYEQKIAGYEPEPMPSLPPNATPEETTAWASEAARRIQDAKQVAVAWQQYLTDLTMAVIPGLEREDAAMLEEQPLRELLQELGVFPDDEEIARQSATMEAEATSPPASTEPVSIGATLTPSSPKPTGSARRSKTSS